MDREVAWKQFKALDMSERAQFFSPDGRMHSCIFPHQFNREFLEYLFRVADAIRLIEHRRDGARFLRDLLFNRRAIMYFAQESTRTRLSFESACHKLGLNFSVVNDLSTSSEVKGESVLETVQAYAQYADLIVMRHGGTGMVERAAWHLQANSRRKAAVINAGSEQDIHVTQGGLDLYSSHRYVGGLDGKILVLAGDMARSRTMRTIAYLARNYKVIKIIMCAPEQFQMKSDILEFLLRNKIPYEQHNCLEPCIPEGDVFYLGRLQDDHDKHDSSVDKAQLFHTETAFRYHHLPLLKPNALVLHPGPRRGELDYRCDEDKRIRYWDQMRNGLWFRAALIAVLLKVEKVILGFFEQRLDQR